LPAGAETIAGLAARLDEAIRVVDAVRDGNASPGDVGGLFPENEEVSWNDQTIQIQHTGLRAEWQAVPAEGGARRQALDRFRARLAAVRAELGPAGPGPTASGPTAGGSPSGVSPGQAARHGGEVVPPPPRRWRERLTEILSRPEFRKQEARESLLAMLIKWLEDKLGFLLPSGAGRVLNKVFGWIIYLLAGAAVLFVLFVLVRVALPLLRLDRREVRPGAVGAPGQPDTPEGLLALADARSRGEDWRGAVQAMFRWLLLRLHLAGRLDYDPALTNREHLVRLSADSGARAAFAELAAQFELAWYALRPVPAEEYAQFRARCQHLAEGPA
jgi:hypothetical protein